MIRMLLNIFKSFLLLLFGTISGTVITLYGIRLIDYIGSEAPKILLFYFINIMCLFSITLFVIISSILMTYNKLLELKNISKYLLGLYYSITYVLVWTIIETISNKSISDFIDKWFGVAIFLIFPLISYISIPILLFTYKIANIIGRRFVGYRKNK